LLALAIACGGLAAYATLRFLNSQVRPVIPGTPTNTARQIVVAAHPIVWGTPLAEADLRLIEMPTAVTPEGYATSIADVVGRPTITSLLANEPILEGKLADRGTKGLTPPVPLGWRVKTMRVSDVSGIGGWIQPGQRVDILLTSTASGEPVTKTIMQNLEVLATGTVKETNEEGQIIATPLLHMLVTLEQAEMLTHAGTQGTIDTALRNEADVKEVQTRGVRGNQLMTGVTGAAPRATSPGTPAAAPTPAPATGGTIDIIVGNQRSQCKYGAAGRGCGGGE
jgi:pilus assembly protein CpaB